MRGKEGNGSRKRGIYRGGVLGGGGEGIRDPEKIGIPAAAARLGVDRGPHASVAAGKSEREWAACAKGFCKGGQVLGSWAGPFGS